MTSYGQVCMGFEEWGPFSNLPVSSFDDRKSRCEIGVYAAGRGD